LRSFRAFFVVPLLRGVQDSLFSISIWTSLAILSALFTLPASPLSTGPEHVLGVLEWNMGGGHTSFEGFDPYFGLTLPAFLFYSTLRQSAGASFTSDLPLRLFLHHVG